MSLDDSELSAHIRRHATRHAAPDRLRANVLAQVALDEAGRATQPPRTARTRRRWSLFGEGGLALNWRPTAVGFAFGLLCAVIAFPLVQRVNVNGSLDTELVADHVRALRSGPLMQVVSTDRHTVKPWFQGRIDYAPPVFDLTPEGFPLRGGRIEHVRGKAVATLAYARDLHQIDLFVWPSESKTPPTRLVNRGFNVLHWADGSMQYWAVSDVEAAELERLAQLWQARVAAQ
jgi:anti-sigma factor RsiW